MFNNIAINTCLGIVFIILLYSLLATILQEIIARWLGLRGRTLQKAIRRMLEDQSAKTKWTFLNYFVDVAQSLKHYFAPFGNQSFAEAFFDAPSIKYLAENTWSSKPSYLSANNFSKTLIQLLKGNSNATHLNPVSIIQGNLNNNTFTGFTIATETREHLKMLLTNSNSDINNFAQSLEEWYNDTMDRSTGWYKKQTQLILFAIGMFIAASFNVDLIAISKILSNNTEARNALVDMATKKTNDYKIIIDSLKTNVPSVSNDSATQKDTIIYRIEINDSVMKNAYNKVNDDIESVNKILGLGTGTTVIDSTCIKKINQKRDSLCQSNNLTQENIEKLYKDYQSCEKCGESISKYQEGRWKIWGWLLTALSISLGAPFWFDLLNKIMLLRGSGQKPKDDTSSNPNNTTPPIKPVG